MHFCSLQGSKLLTRNQDQMPERVQESFSLDDWAGDHQTTCGVFDQRTMQVRVWGRQRGCSGLRGDRETRPSAAGSDRSHTSHWNRPSPTTRWKHLLDQDGRCTPPIRHPRTHTHTHGATENARPDIARLDNSAPYRKGGHRETCFIVRVEAQYKLIFAAGVLYEYYIGCMCVVLLNSV